MHDVATIRSKFEVLRPFLDEQRRVWAVAEALVLGRDSITAVATATGLQRATIRVGIRELEASPTASTAASAAVQLEPAAFHGDGNYAIAPDVNDRIIV